jgi:hypothetical protein
MKKDCMTLHLFQSANKAVYMGQSAMARVNFETKKRKELRFDHVHLHGVRHHGWVMIQTSHPQLL